MNKQPEWIENLQRSRAYYSRVLPEIMAAKRNVWARDPYEWEQAGIRLTPIEQALWHDIRHAGAVLYPQVPVGRFFADFANPVARVIVECDGAAYHAGENAKRDALRDAELGESGWRVHRISGKSCLETDKEDQETGFFSANAGFNFIKRLCLENGISGVLS